MKSRKLYPFVWMTLMYIGTAATATDLPCPAGDSAGSYAVCEGQHIALHFLYFATLAWLVMAAFADASPLLTRRKIFTVTVVLMGVIGMGQEILQMTLRAQLHFEASAFDILVDMTGGALASGAAVKLLLNRSADSQKQSLL